MKQLSDIAKERDTLAKTLQGIQNSIQSHHSLLGNPQQSELTTQSQSDSPLLDNISEKVEDGVRPASIRRTSSDRTDAQSKSPGLMDLKSSQKKEDFGNHAPVLPAQITNLPSIAASEVYVDDVVPSHAFLQDPIIPQTKDECECCPLNAPMGPKATFNMWRFANEVLTESMESSRDLDRFEDAVAEDAPVRALIEGWDAVKRRYGGKLPPSWRKLRRVDEIIFGTCSDRERLAIMLVMHKLMRYHSDPTPARRSKVPPWYLKR
jgi:hypothetical protein